MVMGLISIILSHKCSSVLAEQWDWGWGRMPADRRALGGDTHRAQGAVPGWSSWGWWEDPPPAQGLTLSPLCPPGTAVLPLKPGPSACA